MTRNNANPQVYGSFSPSSTVLGPDSLSHLREFPLALTFTRLLFGTHALRSFPEPEKEPVFSSTDRRPRNARTLDRAPTARLGVHPPWPLPNSRSVQNSRSLAAVLARIGHKRAFRGFPFFRGWLVGWTFDFCCCFFFVCKGSLKFCSVVPVV